ncbi:MAG: DUF1080 domain-containing protein [Pirellulaceae bacterium]|nr:DUF1080 domain-containing protein [Pirellulaceae bacterium]
MRFFALALAACSLLPTLGFAQDKKEESDDGFVSLFDGKSLNQWESSGGGWEVKDGILACSNRGKFLISEKDYADFELEFEFRLYPGTNNGLGIRVPYNKKPRYGDVKSDPAYAGMELQILDNSARQYRNLRSHSLHGAVYGVAGSKKGALKPVGEWNKQTVICKGSHVKVIVNGTVITDVDVIKVSDPKTIDGKAHPGLKRTTGRLVFCGHSTPIDLKNLRIKTLESK